MNKTRNIVLTGLMIAIGIVIVTVLKNFGGQPILRLFSPMHFPVIVAGFVIGPVEGLICGVLTPVLSYLINQLPPNGPWAMMVELGVYGLVCGLGMKMIKNDNPTVKIYITLIIAMILGRIAGGLVTGFILNAGEYSLSAWISAYFIGTAPAIVADLILVPIIVRALQNAGLASIR
ncbi:MAG: ECF transporter S component [Erysipelotrichaceae bacterium]|nr:ECF transporter S component [Erysipelotrichaceae bacterium]